MLLLLGVFDYLREIVLATSAMHKVALHRARGQPHRRELVDALAARGRAYRLLRRALDDLDDAEKPIALIAVVFFINFDLIDSGRGNWRTHIEAAGKLVSSVTTSPGPRGSSSTTTTTTHNRLRPAVAQLADVVVADCITYHILGSLLNPPPSDLITSPPSSSFRTLDIPAFLQRAAAYNYCCNPPLVLDILATAGRLQPTDLSGAARLLARLRALDVRAWVYSIEGLLPASASTSSSSPSHPPSEDDRELRVEMALAHRAAACLYVVLAVPRLLRATTTTTTVTVPPPDLLQREILAHLAAIPDDHPLAKGVVWPTFMAGAQAGPDGADRRWCLERMRAVCCATAPWVCPWGFVDAAMEMLERVWEVRDGMEAEVGGHGSANWLQVVRGMRDHCLIV